MAPSEATLWRVVPERAAKQPVYPRSDRMLRLDRHTLREHIHDNSDSSLHRGRRDVDQRPILARVLSDALPSVRALAELRHEHALARELAGPGILEPLALEQHGHALALIWADPGVVTLRSLLDAGPVPLGLALRIAATLAATLVRVHAHEIIHKRIAPEHVFVEVETGNTYLAGFGGAVRLAREAVAPRSLAALDGMLAYVSPEQTGRMNRGVDRRSDLYSLGALLYELLTGAPPFVADDPVDLLYSHLARQPTPPHERVPGLPRLVSQLTMTLLAKNAEDRYQHARALADELTRCVSELDASGTIAMRPLTRSARASDDALDIPERLYGRAAELRALMAAWRRVSAGASELLLVRGYSGIGKSVLVHELHRELTGARGHFLSGKFDQLGRAVPHAPLARALGQLVHLLLTEPEHELARVRSELADTLGRGGAALLELVPELARIIGPQPAARELGGAAARRRLARAVQQLLAVVTGAGRPLVLFLDDLQWADLASLELLEQLLVGDEHGHLLIIGAYRSNEVDAGHPLTSMCEALEGKATLGVIELGPLAGGDVLRFVADTLATTVERADGLARIVQQKTEGNPFFLIQLLVGLHQDGLLRYEPGVGAGTGQYSWDEPAIRALAVTDNVLAFMGERLGRLSPATRRALELAACIGHQFAVERLAIIAETTPRAGVEALREAVEAGLIVPLDANYRFVDDDDDHGDQLDTRALEFRFLHDRVQQAAYARIDGEQRAALHLRIGRLIAASHAARGESGDAFELVSHLNLGRALIDDATERTRLAALNLAAGRRARQATAYQAARDYFEIGASLLGDQPFAHGYELARDLQLGLAEVALPAGAPEQAEAAIATLLDHARTPLERATVLDHRVVLHAARARSADAVAAGLDGLRLLGIEVPDSEDARAHAYAQVLARVINQLAQLDQLAADSLDELAARPPTGDPSMRVAMQLARHIALSAFGVSTQLGYWLTALAADLSLTHGSSDASASAYALLGAVLASTTTRFAEAHTLVKLALAVHERRGDDVHEACMLGFYFTTVSHYAMHWRELLPYLERARVAGLESGDLLFHAYTCSHRVIARLLLGDALDEVRAEIERSLALMQTHELAAAVATQTVARQLVACLQARTSSITALDESSGDGHGFDEAAFVAGLESGQLSFALYWYLCAKGLLHVLAGQHAQALAPLERTLTMTPIAFTPEARFMLALAVFGLGLDERSPPDTHARVSELRARCRSDYATWAAACPANYLHRHLLIEAEAARVAGDYERAAKGYDAAIDAAEQHDWPRDLALANELCANFYLAHGHPRIARVYMTDAAYAYARWGAVAQVRRLVERHPSLVPVELQRTGVVADAELDAVDMVAFARNLQAIAQEVVLDNVVERIMQTLVHSAGAERGVLVLERDGVLQVCASVTAEPPRIELASAAALDDYAGLPTTLIRYVARLSQAIVIDDAALDDRFASDPYMALVRPRSIACLAMTQQARTRGVLYLENNAVSGVFTPARVELLELLASQAVISIDNADLYARIQAVTDELGQANRKLEAEVDTRTQQLRRANERLELELREREQAGHERARVQAQRLAELSTPVIPLTREILIVPLIGTLDQQRALEVLDVVLDGAHRHAARVVIVDVTGVKHTDGAVLAVLRSMTRALRLIGAAVIVTGIGANMAHALSDMGSGLEQLDTRASLEAGLIDALGRLRV